MQRLIEQPTDEGDLFAGPLRLGRVHYHLAVYQHFSGEEDESVPANLEVEGRIGPRDDVDLAAFHRAGSELTLRLSDGRSLDCALTDEEGRIRSTVRGLYRN
jgi:hypothetical protein